MGELRLMNCLLKSFLYLASSASLCWGQAVLTGTMRNPEGSGFTGRLLLQLAQNVSMSTKGYCSRPDLPSPNSSISISVVNGVLENPPNLYLASCTIPQGIPYIVTAISQSGKVAFIDRWLISTSPFNIGGTTASGTSSEGRWTPSPAYRLGSAPNYGGIGSCANTSVPSNNVSTETRPLSSRSAPAQLGTSTVSIMNYKAVPDAKSDVKCSIASSSSTLTCADGPFRSGDVGKTVSIQYAGSPKTQQPLVTTIIAFESSTEVTIAGTALQTLTETGVIWGTDNYTAFSNWLAALPGRKGLIPPGGYLVDMRQGKIPELALQSNEELEMAFGATLFYVGNTLAAGAQNLFKIPAGSSNITINNFHISGEYMIHASMSGIRQGYGDGTAFYFVTSTRPNTSNVQISNGVFENLFGMGMKDYNGSDLNIRIVYNTFNNNADTSVNVNTSDSQINYNIFNGGSTAIEESGPNMQVIGNTLLEVGGPQYAMLNGGNTSGTPYHGGIVADNVIIDPTGGLGCMDISDGFENGLILNNYCMGKLGGKFGIDSTYNGYTPVGHNAYLSNVMISTGGTGFSNAYYLQQTIEDSFCGNSDSGFSYGLNAVGAKAISGSGNQWYGSFYDVNLINGSDALLRDSVANGTYNTIGGSGGTLRATSLLKNISGGVIALNQKSQGKRR